MIIEKLKKKECWEEFLRYKIDGGHMSKKETEALEGFVKNKSYIAVAEKIADGNSFSTPEIHLINKGFSNKKRTVFTLPEEEGYVQKMMSYLLFEYDNLFADNLYSFRRNMGVKKAVTKLRSAENITQMYSFKIDVSDYFNSVNAGKLIPMLRVLLPEEKRLVDCIEKTLLNPYAMKDGKKIEIQKGIMAGTPLSAFLANIYLRELDLFFSKNNILYARYSDDIIVFAHTDETLEIYKNKIYDTLSELDLGINEEKVFVSYPNEEFTFLGFSFKNNTVDISAVAIKKIKAKMKRKANALIRWKHRKNAEPERAVRAFIRHFNKKFFDNPINNEITWCRWFFPLIDTPDSLAEIDAYMQECIRFIATEKRTKAKYNFRYEDMKRLGYVSLVNSFYKFKKEGIYPQTK